MKPEINMNTLLIQIVLDIKSGRVRNCDKLGLREDEILALNCLTIDELHYLINTSVPFLSFSIHHANLNNMLKQARNAQVQNRQISRALHLGGSMELMRHFFGLPSWNVAALRRLSGVNVGQGRNRALTENQDLAVWLQWRALDTDNRRSPDDLDVMMQIAEQQEISLTSVWHLIKEWSAT